MFRAIKKWLNDLKRSVFKRNQITHKMKRKARLPGGKLSRKAKNGVLGLKEFNAMSKACMMYFYKKRFESGKYAIKVM